MQTFLPDPDFARSAAVLDDARLGKQRVETLQVLRALVLEDYGWSHHPAVQMWRGRVPALVSYGLACAQEWVRRGYADTTAGQIAEFAPEVVGRPQPELEAEGLAPSWLGDHALHASHRAALLRKEPVFYGTAFDRAGLDRDVDPETPYLWPGPDEDASTGDEPTGRRLWVVRPAAVGVLGRFLADGVVGLGPGSGIASDVTGLAGADLGPVLKQEAPGRRPGKALRQLARLLDEVHDGDEVGVPVEHGAALLLGTVRGGYSHCGDGTAPVHRRPVEWGVGRLPREQVRPLGALQDPRELFAVGVATG